jgi:ubiquinone biosynthesis protein Coq4
VEINTKQSFNDLLESLVEEILDEEDLEEINTTASVGGEYMTPMAFDPEGKKKKKKKKIGEALESNDIEIIKKLIRKTVGDIYRDIWIKRNSVGIGG